jgi:hypothetical protein
LPVVVVLVVVVIVIEKPRAQTDYEDEDDAPKGEDWPVIMGQLLELETEQNPLILASLPRLKHG